MIEDGIVISKETYQELLETERKYLILLEEVKNLSNSLVNYQETLENVLKNLKSIETL